MLKFDLTLKRIPVELTIEGKPHNYYLKELDGEQRDEYLEAARTRFGTGEEKETKSLKGINAYLTSLCLYDETDTLVKEATIQKWPVSVRNELFSESQKLNGLDKKTAEAESKKD